MTFIKADAVEGKLVVTFYSDGGGKETHTLSFEAFVEAAEDEAKPKPKPKPRGMRGRGRS